MGAGPLEGGGREACVFGASEGREVGKGESSSDSTEPDSRALDVI